MWGFVGNDPGLKPDFLVDLVANENSLTYRGVSKVLKKVGIQSTPAKSFGSAVGQSEGLPLRVV